MSHHTNWTSEREDLLREIGNIGAGHAASALSSLLQNRVDISVTSARLCDFDNIANSLGGAEELAAGVFLRMTGDINGNMMLLLSIPSAKKLIQRLIPTGVDETDFSEMEISVLAEVGNILGGSYMNAICMLTEFQLTQSVPAVAVDMAGAILDIGILSAGEMSDTAILIDTAIRQGDAQVEGHFFLLPDPDSLTPLFAALRCPDV